MLILAKLASLSKITVGRSAGLGLCRLENQRKIAIYATIFSNLCFERHETMNVVDSMVTITSTRLDKTGDALAAETKIFRSEGGRP